MIRSRVFHALSMVLLALGLPQSASAVTPDLSKFVLYAERSVNLGTGVLDIGGDIGVRSTAATAFGPQLSVASNCIVDLQHTVFSPSVVLGNGSSTGEVQTNSIQNNGGHFAGQSTFPATTMPPLPLAFPGGSAGPAVTVSSFGFVKLTPGNYGALVDNGTLELSPGNYSFSTVTLSNAARIWAPQGGVHISVAGKLTAGSLVTISPGFLGKADQLTISVAGSDDPKGTAGYIGQFSFVHALLAAPNGTLVFDEGVQAIGAFTAFDIKAEPGTVVKFETGFSPSTAGQHGSQQLSGYFAVESDPIAGPVPPDTKIALSFGLSVRDPAGLAAFLKQVSDPNSPNYRKYMTQPQFYATYGATAADYQSLRTWSENAGFAVTGTYPNNLLLAIIGTAAQIEQALFINLNNRLRPDGTTFVTPDRDPSLNLSVPILHITGLGDRVPPQHLAINGTGQGGTYRAADLRNAYLGVGSACQMQNLTGAGQVIGIVDFAVFQNSDISSYFALQNPPINPPNFPAIVAVEGGNPAANSALEATLDVELAQAMAPNAQILLFQGSSGLTGHLDDILHAMATSNPPLTVVSCSLIF